MEDLLRDSRQELSWRMKMKVARDIASGMAFLHSKKIYHRDLASKVCQVCKACRYQNVWNAACRAEVRMPNLDALWVTIFYQLIKNKR